MRFINLVLLNQLLCARYLRAQKEIRDYVELLEWTVMGWVPMAWEDYCA